MNARRPTLTTMDGRALDPGHPAHRIFAPPRDRTLVFPFDCLSLGGGEYEPSTAWGAMPAIPRRLRLSCECGCDVVLYRTPVRAIGCPQCGAVLVTGRPP